MPDNQTRLEYSFTSTPNPIRVSIGGSAPVDSLIDLQVMIDNRGSSVNVTKIEIEIPVGGSGATGGNRLSAASALPEPAYDRTGPWKIEVSGSTVTITPRDKSVGTLAAAILFTLKDIKVNETVGSVPIKITETAPTLIVNDSRQLDKLPADFPVKRFYAVRNGQELNPAILTAFDQMVLLKWECSEQGMAAGYSYNVRTIDDNWYVKDCLNGGDCFGCQDGISGVQSPRLRETTTFALDVIHTDERGRSIQKTLLLTVRLAVPRIVETAYYQDLYFSGCIARLGWIAADALKCTVELDGKIIDDNAPLDTYEDGYQVVVPITDSMLAGSALPKYSVTPHGLQGSRPHRQAFPEIFIPPLITIPMGFLVNRIALMPDGSHVLVIGGSSVKVIDIASGVVSDSFNVDQNFFNGGLAITPDGKYAFAIKQGGMVRIDLINRRTDFFWETDPSHYITDRQFAVVIANNSLLTFDMTGGILKFDNIAESPSLSPALKLRSDNVYMEPPRWSSCMAITPDGKLAFVGGDSLNVIDIDAWAWKEALDWGLVDSSGSSRPTIDYNGSWMDDAVADIAVTPDGALALAVTAVGRLLVINVQAQQVIQSIQLYSFDNATDRMRSGDMGLLLGWSIAISPDSTLAFIAAPGHPITLFDISKREVVSKFVGGDDPRQIVITPDGKRALIANYSSQNVTMTTTPED